MGRLTSFEIRELPELWVVGKAMKYDMAKHMQNNTMGELWNQALAGNAFGPLECQDDFVFDYGYVGWMADWAAGDGCFTYIVGMLMKPGAKVPEGYTARSMPAQRAAVGYITGKDTQDVCSSAHQETERVLKEKGYSCDKSGWCMELYNCPRYTTPDANGEITLDYYIPID